RNKPAKSLASRRWATIIATAVALSATGAAAIGAQDQGRAAVQPARFRFDLASKPLSQALADFGAITGV
ncbi:hypothetical protein, partial [Acinetobacter baumannii]|uniref:hypothetical protein n=1 Tax=Acinetobacter baumannii TaxID=470 RepID=UPI0013D81A8D